MNTLQHQSLMKHPSISDDIEKVVKVHSVNIDHYQHEKNLRESRSKRRPN